MNKELLIKEIVKRLNKYDRISQIKVFLKQNRVKEDKIDEYIKIAKVRIENKKRTFVSLGNKLLFSFFLICTLVTLIAGIFILPYYNFTHYYIVSFVDALAFTFFSFLSFIFYSWGEESIKVKAQNRIRANFYLLIFFSFPGTVVLFIFAYIFESQANETLKNTQVETIGTVLYGRSIKTKDIEYYEITLRFDTQEGTEIIATEDLASYEFPRFKKGQKVRLIYSSENPKNIDLLTHKSDVQYFKDSEERAVKLTDLQVLLGTQPQHIGNVLNKITSGWKYDKTTASWINLDKKLSLIKTKSKVIYTTKGPFLFTFRKQQRELKYIEAPTNSRNKIFLSEKYLLEITSKIENKSATYVISITYRKQE